MAWPSESPTGAEGEIACAWRCGVCTAVCDRDALRDVPAGLVIDRSRCSRCLACAAACPAGLIRAALIEGEPVG